MVPKKILQLGLLLWFTSCSNSEISETTPSADSLSDSLAIQIDTAIGVEIKLSKSGHVNSIIKSQMMVRVLQAGKPSQTFLYNGVEIRFLNEKHDLLNIVNSKKGYYDEVDKYVILEDSVVVRNIEQESLRTEYLTWADSTHQFYTDQDVVIKTKQQKINGTGLWASEDFSTYTIKQIKGVIQVENNTF